MVMLIGDRQAFLAFIRIPLNNLRPRRGDREVADFLKFVNRVTFI